MVPGSFEPPNRYIGGMAAVDDGRNDIVSILCIGMVPNRDGKTWRAFFMNCHGDGRISFYEDPDTQAARSSKMTIEP